ncbi:hypothetical protein L6164_018407 [Bauhinia variegata]|uniref:Uncharacterized protein n=1 Tax=Bauhinia variegata TaxID=167791 RepID=A0ACB9NCC6_BAUVA|nr:hypothetical protein L6164_018407 [Bauhinia variegata]
MLHSQCHHHLLLPKLPIPSSLTHNPSLSLLSASTFPKFSYKPTILHPVSSIPQVTSPWLAQIVEFTEQGSVELSSIFATTDDPSRIQVAASVLLTGAITAFLFPSVRRRAKRAKELKFRSSGVKKSLKAEALDSLRVMRTSSNSIKAKSPPSPAQALFGSIYAGIIFIILYKFTTTIEAALNRQTISDNFSVRQITITIRTIINGLCYLLTFVFGFNSLGLFLYSGQLAIDSFMEGSTERKSTKQPGLSNSAAGNAELRSKVEDQSSDDAQ